MKLKLRDGREQNLPSDAKARTRYVADLFRNQGRNLDEDFQMDWDDMYKLLSPKHTDAVTTPDIRPLLQTSMETLIREPVEPMMVITGLFTKVMSKGLNTQILAGAIGSVTAADIPEHGTYPEVNFQIGGAMQTAWIGKSGIAASFTDEALRYSTWDIMAMNFRLMGQALVRHKEQKAVSFLRRLGTVLFDNMSPSTSMFGVLTGRGLDMQPNGTLTVDDLFKAIAHMSEEGFTPDVMLLNPLFFLQFLQDPVMRNMMLAHGGGSYFEKWNGNPGPLDPWSNGSMGAMGPTLGNKVTAMGNAAGETPTGIAGREHGMTSYSNVPMYFPWNFRIIVSPLVPFDAASQLGDIYLLSSGNVGFYLVDEEATSVEWRDENVEVAKVKIRERYGFAIAHEGQGVGVIKNVKCGRNYFDGTVTAHTMAVDSEISPTADVLS